MSQREVVPKRAEDGARVALTGLDYAFLVLGGAWCLFVIVPALLTLTLIWGAQLCSWVGFERCTTIVRLLDTGLPT